MLRTILIHPWIEYEDATGRHGAEPDAVIVPEGDAPVVCVEVKLTGCLYAVGQLRSLYGPLLRELYARPVRYLQVCRAVGPATPGPFVDDVVEFLKGHDEYATLQWAGR